MNKILLWILLILWVLLGLWLSHKYFCGSSAPAAAVAPVPTKNACDTQWTIKDGSSFKFSSKENIKFQRSSFSPYALSENVKNAMMKTAEYLKGHDNRNILITGYYDNSEKNHSVLPDLGLARASSIKRLLEDYGAQSSQIELASKQSMSKCWSIKSITKNGVAQDINILHNGVDLSFGKMAKNDERLAVIKKRLFGKAIVLHFATDSDHVDLTAQQRQDFADLIYYTDRVSGARLDIDGHTDNVGERDYNINLSKERAEFAKNYLRRNGGISIAKMDVAGYGPDKPVATNATEEGKAMNRRVEVTLK